MRHIIILFTLSIFVCACSRGRAYEMAERYTREHTPDARHVHALEPDSVLSDLIMSFLQRHLYDRPELCDTIIHASDLILTSCRQEPVDDDIIHEWRYTYPVAIEYNDGTTDTIRVVMDSDGYHPRCFLDDYMIHVYEIEEEARSMLMDVLP